jgi:hypothetical protein
MSPLRGHFGPGTPETVKITRVIRKDLTIPQNLRILNMCPNFLHISQSDVESREMFVKIMATNLIQMFNLCAIFSRNSSPKNT